MRSKASASFLKKRSKKLFLMLGHWLWRGHRPSLTRHDALFAGDRQTLKAFS
jgi:hypothetical protein